MSEEEYSLIAKAIVEDVAEKLNEVGFGVGWWAKSEMYIVVLKRLNEGVLD